VYEYRTDFYRLLASFAVQSAERIVPKVAAAVPVRNVVDFGCGHGAWLSVWAAMGVSVTGIDGPYVNRRHLLIDAENFHAVDLAAPIGLASQFDLVQSLEVAEHLPAAKAGQFVDTLTAHGPCVLFSAAVPGQGGENHLNEQPADYWRAKFRERGYAAVDYLRPLIFRDKRIARWYRYNILLYVRDDMIASLHEAVRQCRVPDTQSLDEYWPLFHRLRHAVIRQLPTTVINRLACGKAALAARRPQAVQSPGNQRPNLQGRQMLAVRPTKAIPKLMQAIPNQRAAEIGSPSTRLAATTTPTNCADVNT
jgi:SAM-dependent methyltransferase